MVEVFHKKIHLRGINDPNHQKTHHCDDVVYDDTSMFIPIDGTSDEAAAAAVHIIIAMIMTIEEDDEDDTAAAGDDDRGSGGDDAVVAAADNDNDIDCEVEVPLRREMGE